HATWLARPRSGYHAELRRTVDDVVLYQLMSLANNASASTQVRAIATTKLEELKEWITGRVRQTKDEEEKAHYTFALSEIRTFEEDPKELNLSRPVEPPDGPPIGDWGCDLEGD